MSLASNISGLATRIGTEFKAVYAKIGTLTSLTTTTKTDLVSAINEVKASVGSAGAAINDTTPSGTTTYSSNKINTQIATKPSIDDVTAGTTTVYSSSKTNTAISTAVSAKPSINDTTASSTSVYSSTKTDSQISTAVSGLVASAPAALDTLNELATALGNDAAFATTTATSLGNRLRFDAAQTLTGPQQTQGQANLGVTSSTNVGDTTTDFVTVFTTALA